MVDTKPRNTTLKKLARWNPSSPSSAGMSSVPPLSSDAPFTHVHHEQLQQGALYIIKIKQVSIAMFEGWNDDMCCFSILRSEVEPLRWSDARQLPGDFDIYDAFDECGNPPIHLWSRYLKVLVPRNWFCMFEEAKRRQRDWHMRQQQQQQQLIRRSMVQEHDQNEYYYPPAPEQDPSTVTNAITAVDDSATDAVYSNTDVSSMSLNHQGSTTESLMAPSVVASTNIIDPIMMSQEHTSNLRHHPSVTSTSTHVTRSRVLSSAPSYRENSSIERSGSIMDREQIRRHLAPGQAKITTRSSGSVVTLASTVTSLSPLNKSPTLIHHRSKELVHGIPEEQSIDQNDAIKTESNISALSDELDFPHDSDRFSIRSDISAVNSPSLKPSVSSKSRNRASVKKIIWG